MDLGERSEYALFVGAAEWTRDSGAQEDDDDMFVEVMVDGASSGQTMDTRTAHWDEYIKMCVV
ncbi:hypothetical protein FIBSPDRAFT_846478 [Athelia psychrophila]|uniref:Uncharacterized protein n=1 Tax=Athelia psychrophila TaxID=1759441 RepID=A0A166X2X1_9AGAM|nr:hypothetical protein FIBSPDRAFT_846478 [Fibularhizoctonia sp. CBS 109695]